MIAVRSVMRVKLVETRVSTNLIHAIKTPDALAIKVICDKMYKLW